MGFWHTLDLFPILVDDNNIVLNLGFALGALFKVISLGTIDFMADFGLGFNLYAVDVS